MLVSGEEAYWGLCAVCRQKLDYSLEDRCSVCGRPLISEIDICMHCRDSESEGTKFLDAMTALYPYTGIYRQLLASYKFKQYKQLSHFLASKLIETGRELRMKCKDTLTWVPVPPRPGKIKRRGWDQIDYLAENIKKDKDVSVSKCLKRLNSRAQKTLNRNERLLNVKEQIICLEKAPKNALVFDDVVTTGATLEACAEALKKAGTEQVFAVCLFYD